jgi:hypothetical protein
MLLLRINTNFNGAICEMADWICLAHCRGPGPTSSVPSEPHVPKGLANFLIKLITTIFSNIYSPDFVGGRDVEMKSI